VTGRSDTTVSDIRSLLGPCEEIRTRIHGGVYFMSAGDVQVDATSLAEAFSKLEQALLKRDPLPSSER